MKVSPIAAGTAVVNPNEGTSASPDRIAKAKAIAAGQEIKETPLADKQADRVQNSIKKIKMRTQRSPDRHLTQEEPAVEAVASTETPTVEAAPSDELATTEQAPVASEETKPLSPQFAALARQKREIQLAQQKLEADKAEFATQTGGTKSLEEYRARIKANALKVLQEEGVTYDQLTEQILASQESEDLSGIKAQIKALEEGFNTRLSERDAVAEQQVKAQIKLNVEQLISQGDDFEMVREAGYGPKVVDLIDKVWKKEGVLLSETEALTMMEKELLEESLKFAKLKKVQSMLNPAQPEKTQPVQQDRPGTKVMRTLTNRDGSSSVSMSKRERAIAAMEGRLK